VLLWQLNEPWPSISWALLDFYRNPKPAYDMVKRLFAPLLVSIEYAPARFRPGDRLCTQVWIINDQAQAIPTCQMEVVLWNRVEEAVNRFARTVDVSPDSAEVVGSFCWRLPSGGGWRLTSKLTRDGQLLAINEYDLATCDDIKPTLRQRLRSWLVSQVTPT
jgi:beta-mannosidase